MDQFLLILGLAGLIFFMGYDYSSYMMMRRVDKFYKKRNKWFLGYNTFKVWQTARTVMKD